MLSTVNLHPYVAEVAAAMRCAPTADLSSVAAYAPFNERVGSPTTAVYSHACGVDEWAACAKPAVNANTSAVSDETASPLSDAQTSLFGVLDAATSDISALPPTLVAGHASPVYDISARDGCG